MSVEFRQRTPGEYTKILWNRKWLIILPTIAIATAIAIVVLRLPNVYESTTLVVVKPSTISEKIVPTLTVDLTLLLNNINQVVNSRSTLEPLINKYRPYDAVGMGNDPMEILVDQMRKDMKVEIDKSADQSTSGFRISYRSYDPRTTQAITAELANRYVAEQIKSQDTTGRQTSALFEQQVKEAKEQLDEIAKQRLDFMQKNLGILPSESAALLSQLSGLQEQQKALITETGRLRDRRAELTSSLGDLEQLRQQEAREVAGKTTDPKTTFAWSQLVQQKAAAEAELQRLLTELRPKHPDVVAKKAQLDSIQNEMDQQITAWKAKIKEEEERLGGLIDPRVRTTEANLKTTESELARQEAQLQQTAAQINEIQSRINRVPGAQVALETMDRDYQTRKTIYDDLLAKKTEVDRSEIVTNQLQGEKIQVLDPASMPQAPVAPKRMMLIGMGVGLGLFVGLLLAAVFEAPRLLTIQTSSDAEHYTGLPLLVAVPELLTPQEARRIPARRLLLLAAGIVATILSIPVLAMILRASHFFERFV